MNQAAVHDRTCLLGFLVLSLSSATASASQSAKLVYARTADAADCGEGPALRQAVARRLGYDPFVAVSDNTVVAELRSEGEGLRARVFVIERGNAVGGVRELSAKTKDCSELMQAVALAISIAIDPESIDRVVDPTVPAKSEVKPEEIVPETVAQPASPAAVEPSFPPNRIAPPPKRVDDSATTIWRFGVAGNVATGPAPMPVLGVAGSLMLAGRRWSLGLEPRWTAASKTQPQAGTGARATTSMIGLTLVPCYRIDSWCGCYLVELGRLASEGDVSQSKRDASFWGAQGLRLAYRVGGERGFGATAQVDGLVAINRVTMVLNEGTVHQTPWPVGRAAIELNYTF